MNYRLVLKEKGWLAERVKPWCAIYKTPLNSQEKGLGGPELDAWDPYGWRADHNPNLSFDPNTPATPHKQMNKFMSIG